MAFCKLEAGNALCGTRCSFVAGEKYEVHRDDSVEPERVVFCVFCDRPVRLRADRLLYKCAGGKQFGMHDSCFEGDLADACLDIGSQPFFKFPAEVRAALLERFATCPHCLKVDGANMVMTRDCHQVVRESLLERAVEKALFKASGACPAVIATALARLVCSGGVFNWLRHETFLLSAAGLPEHVVYSAEQRGLLADYFALQHWPSTFDGAELQRFVVRAGGEVL